MIERSLFHPPTLKDTVKSSERVRGAFNLEAHTESHDSSWLIYTSGTTLDLIISDSMYLPFTCHLAGVSASVEGAPTAGLVWDVLVSGDSIFSAAADRIQIDSGDFYGDAATPALVMLSQNVKLQVQGITISAATGPIKVYFQLDRI